MSNYITLSDDNLLAEYVSLDKFKGVLEQRIAIGPDMLAMLIKDGQIAEASAGAHFAIGGLWQTLKDAIGGRHAIRLLIADLKPFQVPTTATALTKDNVPVACEFTIEMQVNPEKPANVLGFMKEHSAVTKASVLQRLAPHLGERVLAADVRKMNALELRGNTGLQDMIQANAMKEVERISADIGFIARVVSVGFGFNEEEKAEILKRQQQREQEQLEREFQILNRSIEREAESSVVRLETDLKLEKVKVRTEDDLRKMILSNELGFVDARETGVRIQQMKALEHELQLNRTQRLDGLKAQLEAEQHAIEMARTGGDRRQVGREIELKDRKHDVDLAKVGGERLDVEMDTAKRQQIHQLEVSRIQAEIRVVTRSVEELDRKQALNLARLEELQKLEIAAKAHEDQVRTLRDLEAARIEAEARRLDIKIKGDDAQHSRGMESVRQQDLTALEKMRLQKDMTPEQIMAIGAGLSPQVANVLIEQAKAKTAEGADRMALMREMIQQANDAKISSEAQARHFFDQGIQGVQGVAQGVGQGVGVGLGAAGGVVDRPVQGPGGVGTTECPGCHRVIPTTDRHCRYCGRQMRQ
jgi:hypothetical protein